MAEPQEQKLSLYNYYLTSIDILIGGETISVNTGMVSSFSKQDDYENNFFPLFSIKFRVKVLDYYKILKNITQVKFRIRLQKSVMDNVEPIKSSAKVTKEDVFNEIFVTYLSESTPNFDEKMIEKSQEVAGSSNRPEDYKAVEFFFFKEQDVNGSKNVINVCLGSLTVTDMICLLFQRAGLVGNVLMERLDNQTSHSEMIMPPITFFQAINYLETYYGGIYDAPKLIYFDFDTKYFLKQKPGCRAWRTNEYKQCIILIRQTKDQQKKQVSCEKRSKEKCWYISVDPDNVKVNKSSVANDAVSASNVVLVNAKSGAVSNLSSTAQKRGSGAQKVVYSDLGNSTIGSVEQNRINSKETSIGITVENVDIDAIKPNKEFILKFLDNSLGEGLSGTYRLAKASHNFVSNGDQGFNLESMLVFKK